MLPSGARAGKPSLFTDDARTGAATNFARECNSDFARVRRAAYVFRSHLNALFAFYKSSVGKKWVVALTGLALVGFVIGHLIGNLQIFLPPDYINTYAQKLQSLVGTMMSN